MFKWKIISFVPALLLLTAAVQGVAQETDPTRKGAASRPAPGQLFNLADSNGDGKVTLAEIQARRPQFPAERFSALDKNGDGALEPGELGAGPAPAATAPGGRLRAADTDGDGRISKAEFSAQFPGAGDDRFAMLDKNDDGFIDPRDRSTSASTEKKSAGKKSNQGTTADPDGHAYLEKLVRNHDADQDGRVTLVELTAAKHGFPPAVFSVLDRDNDGALTSADAGPRRTGNAPEETAAKAPKKKPGNKKAAPSKKPKLDVNGDGKITFDEAQQVNPNITRERFDARDTNGDGVLSRADRKK